MLQHPTRAPRNSGGTTSCFDVFFIAAFFISSPVSISVCLVQSMPPSQFHLFARRSTPFPKGHAPLLRACLPLYDVYLPWIFMLIHGPLRETKSPIVSPAGALSLTAVRFAALLTI